MEKLFKLPEKIYITQQMLPVCELLSLWFWVSAQPSGVLFCINFRSNFDEYEEVSSFLVEVTVKHILSD